MVASKIILLYSCTWEPILTDIEKCMTEDKKGNADIREFATKLGELRNALSCSVCNQLLTNREVLCPGGCEEHFVCKGCKGKDREKGRKCDLCEDWNTFEYDDSLKIILESYQNFCHYVLTCESFVQQLELKQEADPTFNTFKLIDLMGEGLKGRKRIRNVSSLDNRGTLSAQDQRKYKKVRVATTSTATTTSSSTQVNVAVGTSQVRERNDAKMVDVSKFANPIEKGVTQIEKISLPKPLTPAAAQSVDPGASSNSGMSTTTSSPVKATVVNSMPATAKIKVESSSPTPTYILPDDLPSPVKTFPPTNEIKDDGRFENIRKGTEMFAQSDESNEKPMQQKSPAKTPPAVSVPSSFSAVFSTPPKASTTSISSPSVTSTLAYSLSGISSSTTSFSPSNLSSALSSSLASSPMTASGAISVNSLPFRISPNLMPSSTQGTTQIYHFTHPMLTRAVIRPHHVRLASSLNYQGRTLPVHVIGPTPQTQPNESMSIPNTSAPQTSSITAAPRRKIIVTSASPSEIQQWPDPTKVLQIAAGDFSRLSGFSSAPIRSQNVVTVGPTSTASGPRYASVNIRQIVSGSLVRPANANASVSASCTGSATTTSSSSTRIPAPGTTQSTPPQMVKPATVVANTVRPDSPAVIQVPVSTPSSTAIAVTTAKRKQEGCRCGNATPNPGKLTCIGQRCACYADGNACSDCKCKGCKNPYLPGSGGKKLLHGMRALLDPKTNQAIPIVGSLTAPSTSNTVTSAPAPLVSTVGTSSFGPIQTVSGPVSNPPPSIQLIPIRIGPQGTTQYIQIANPQALTAQTLQQIPLLLSSGQLTSSNPAPAGYAIHGLPISGLSAGIHQVTQVQQRPPQMNLKPDHHQGHPH